MEASDALTTTRLSVNAFDCRTRMAGSIFYLAPVDNASGKIFGKKQKFVAVRRKQGKRQRGCAVMGERTTPYGANEIAWQEKFAQICAATRERMIDPNHVAQDQADFAAQSKYKTFYQYVWNLMRDQIESGQ